MGPLVSILIPTCDRPELVLKAIHSALLQSYKNIEVIVMDNSLSSESEKNIEMILDSRLYYFRNKTNIGPILNWRKSLDHANGEYCVLLPDDDYLINPFYIEDAVKIALNNKVRLVITDCVIAKPNIKFIGSSGCSGLIDGHLFIEQYLKGLSIPTIANLFDRQTALELNAFHTNDILYSDIELWMKFMSIGKAYCYNVPSVFYLFHNENIVTNMEPDALIKNSKYIRSSVESFASDILIYELVCRYITFTDQIYGLASHSFIHDVFKENRISKSPREAMLRCQLRRIKAVLSTQIKRVINK